MSNGHFQLKEQLPAASWLLAPASSTLCAHGLSGDLPLAEGDQSGSGFDAIGPLEVVWQFEIQDGGTPIRPGGVKAALEEIEDGVAYPILDFEPCIEELFLFGRKGHLDEISAGTELGLSFWAGEEGNRVENVLQLRPGWGHTWGVGVPQP